MGPSAALRKIGYGPKSKGYSSTIRHARLRNTGVPGIFSYFRRAPAARRTTRNSDDAIDLESIGGAISTVYVDIASAGAPPAKARMRTPAPSYPQPEPPPAPSPPPRQRPPPPQNGPQPGLQNG